MSSNIRLVYSICPFCGAGCGFYLVVRDDVVIGVERIFDHPVSVGVLCPKGAYAWKLIRHPDRLTTPLKRTERGFKPISWREAIRLIADRIKELRKDDPDSMYFLASTK